MPTRFRMTVTARRKTCLCDLCEKEIAEGLIYSTVAIYFGLSKAGKGRYKTLKLHMTNCLALWMIKDYADHKERVKDRRGGRPPGTGLDLEPELKLKRKKLVWRRAYTLRQFLLEDNTEKARSLIQKAVDIDKEIRAIAPISTIMNRRDPQKARAIKGKCDGLKMPEAWSMVRHI